MRRLRRAESWISRRFGSLFVAAERMRPNGAAAARVGRRALLLAASLVPGLPHLLLGNSRTGWAMLLAFIGVTLMWVLLMGTVVATLMWMAALSLVLTSTTDAMRTDSATGQHRRFRFEYALMGLGLVGAAYGGANLLLAALWERVTVVTPIVRATASDTGAGARSDPIIFDRGDCLLFSRRAYRDSEPKRGDVVLTSRGDILYIDRVVAVPGDDLEYSGNRLYLNGAPLESRAYPLQPAVPFEVEGARVRNLDWSGRVQEGGYLVWGIQYPEEAGHAQNEVGMGPTRVGRSQIRGRAWLVYCPFRHRRIVDHTDPAPK